MVPVRERFTLSPFTPQTQLRYKKNMLGRQTVNITDQGAFHRNDHGFQHISVIRHTEAQKAQAALERAKDDLNRLNARITKEMHKTFTGKSKEGRGRGRGRGRRRRGYDSDSEEDSDSDSEGDVRNYGDDSFSTDDDDDDDDVRDDSDDSDY